MKTFILGLLMLGASTTALADDHRGGGDVVAMQVHYCTLNDGKDMVDVDKALDHGESGRSRPATTAGLWS